MAKNGETSQCLSTAARTFGAFLLPQIELNDKHFKVFAKFRIRSLKSFRSADTFVSTTVFIETFALLSMLYVHLQSYVTIDVEFLLLYDLTCLSNNFSSTLTGNCVWPRDLTKRGQLLHPPGQSKSTQRFQISLNRLRDIAALSMRLNFSGFSQKALECWHSFESKQMLSAKTGDTRSSDLSKQTRTIRSTNPRNDLTHIMHLETNSASKFLFLEAFNLSSIQITFRFPRMWFMIFLPFLPVVLHK